MVEPAILWMGARLWLGGGVDIDALQVWRVQGAGVETKTDGLRQRLLHAVRPDAFWGADQRGRIADRLLLEIVEAAERLLIRGLDLELEQALIADTEAMLNTRPPRH